MVCYFMSDNVLLKNLPNSKGVTIMKIVQGCGGRGAGGVEKGWGVNWLNWKFAVHKAVDALTLRS